MERRGRLDRLSYMSPSIAIASFLFLCALAVVWWGIPG
jgi:hypothetical protein